jgi:hypothetical protein
MSGQIETNFVDFLCTGSLGELKIGRSRHFVLCELGEPQDWSVTKRIKYPSVARVWKYGCVQMGFNLDDEVGYIGIYLHINSEFPPQIQLKNFLFSSETTFQEVVDFLSTSNIAFEVALEVDRTRKLVLESGVSVRFTDDNTLWSITTAH